jgi:integrase/recombinase XerD
MKLLETQDGFLSWLAARRYAPGTIRVRALCLRDLIAFLKERYVEDVEEVTRAHVDEYQRMILNRVHRNTGRKLAPSTMGHYLETVRVFFSFLVDRKSVLVDPSAHMEWKLPHSPLPKNIPTPEEMRQILTLPDIGTFTGLRDRTMLEVLYSTGVRRMELCHLDIYDVNLGDGTLTVRSGKGGKGRTVPLLKTASEFLDRYMREARPGLVRWKGESEMAKQETALFVSPGGKRMPLGNVGAVIARYVRVIRPDATLGCHVFRHACATHLLQGGADVAMIQRLLGHSKLDTTAIYTQVMPMDLKAEHKRCHPRRKP